MRWLPPLFLAASLWPFYALADKVRVAVASNFTHTAKRIATAFESETGHKVSLAYGSSGKLTAQIHNGAPFDILLSADTQKPAKLIQWGQALPESEFTYALGALVLWSKDDTTIEDGPKTLKAANFRHLAVANPNLAPYGRAAEETLKKLSLDKKLRKQRVEGENISQTYQFVASGTAKLGFVALSQVITNGQLESGSAWHVPAELHQPIRQNAVLLKKAKSKAAAHEFLEFLKSKTALDLIEQTGYRLPAMPET